MANLTKYDKQKMIRNIMGDIPEIDYQAQAVDYVISAITPLLPKGVQALLNDSKTSDWVATAQLSSDCHGIKVQIPSDNSARWLSRRTFREIYGDEIDNKFSEFCRLKTQQKTDRDEMREQLSANFSSVRTFAIFRQRFPELAHYLPPEKTVSNLPATNDLAERLKAMGLNTAVA
jgi:hypothetical protein